MNPSAMPSTERWARAASPRLSRLTAPEPVVATKRTSYSQPMASSNPPGSRQALHMALASSSRRFAERAFSSHEQSDWEGFMVNAVTAVELLAKAVLASINPALLADPNHEQSLMILAQGEPRGEVLVSLRTIGADKAISRVSKLGVSFDAFAEDLNALRSARNAVVHIGTYPRANIDRAFDGWVRSMVELCKRAQYSPKLIFGENTDLVELQLQQSRSSTAALWQQRRAAAERRWNSLYRDLDPEGFQRRFDLLESDMISANALDPSLQWVKCAVCGLPAHLYGEFEPEADFDYGDGEEYISGVYWDFVPRSISCSTCHLNLDSRRLVEQSSMLADWEVDEDDRLRWEEDLKRTWRDERYDDW